jgi:hypothetical protein
MNTAWKILLLSAVVFAVAYGAAQVLVPDVVPVAFADELQPLWSLETAFVLRAIELMAAGIAAIALLLMVGMWVKSLRRTP